MRRREFTPNDTRGVIRILSFRYAGTARGRNRILLATVILCIVALTMVFGITRGKIRAEELNAIRTAGTAQPGRQRPESWKMEMHPSMQRLRQQDISGRPEDA